MKQHGLSNTVIALASVLVVVFIMYQMGDHSTKDENLKDTLKADVYEQNTEADYEKGVVYELKLLLGKPEDMNTYPQKVRELWKTGSSYLVKVQVANKRGVEYFNQNPVPLKAYSYNKDVLPYLDSSTQVESEDGAIISKSNEICGSEEDTLKYILSAAKWVGAEIPEDDEAQISKTGDGNGESAKETLTNKKASLAGKSNLFIALMRTKGIPARFVYGCRYIKEKQLVYGYYWAECFVKGIGWIPVDPDSGTVGMNNQYIKLAYGKDYANIRKESNVKKIEVLDTY